MIQDMDSHTAQTALYGLSMGSIGVCFGTRFAAGLAFQPEWAFAPQWYQTALNVSNAAAVAFAIGMLGVIALDYRQLNREQGVSSGE